MPTGLGDELLWLCPSLDDSPNDLSGNGNNGTYENGISTVADSDPTYGGSRAYSFDGVDEYIDCGTSVISNTSFSMSCWFNTDTTSGAGSFAGSYHWQAGERSFYIRRDNTDVAFLVASNGASAGGNVQIYSTTTVSIGTWYHVAATWSSVSGKMELFINGVSEATSTQSVMAPLIEPLVLGAYSAVPEGLFNGKQDDIRFFQRVLTQPEITLLASTRGFTAGGGTHINRTLLGVG